MFMCCVYAQRALAFQIFRGSVYIICVSGFLVFGYLTKKKIIRLCVYPENLIHKTLLSLKLHCQTLSANLTLHKISHNNEIKESLK